jgi:putative endopeptidase
MKYNLIIATAAVSALAFTSCDDKKTAQADTEERGIILSNMDIAVSPKDDFYNYVNRNP